MSAAIWCWLVWREGATKNEARLVTAVSATEAAEAWAEYADHRSVEYAIAKGEPARVLVQLTSGHEILLYEVVGRSVPKYTATIVRKHNG